MWYVPHSRLRLLEIQLRRRFNGVLSSGLFCLGLSSNQLCCYHHRHMSFLRRRRLTKIIPMIHQYLPTKTHIYDSCIPTNYESIARPDQEIKARLTLCSQWNNNTVPSPTPLSSRSNWWPHWSWSHQAPAFVATSHPAAPEPSPTALS